MLRPFSVEVLLSWRFFLSPQCWEKTGGEGRRAPGLIPHVQQCTRWERGKLCAQLFYACLLHSFPHLLKQIVRVQRLVILINHRRMMPRAKVTSGIFNLVVRSWGWKNKPVLKVWRRGTCQKRNDSSLTQNVSSTGRAFPFILPVHLAEQEGRWPARKERRSDSGLENYKLKDSSG